MIYEKSLSSPAYRRRSLRRGISLFGEKNGTISAYGLHFRQSDRGIVCAEGATSLGAEKELILTSGHAEEVFERTDGALLSPQGTRYPLPQAPDSLLCFAAREGGKEYFALTASGCYKLGEEGAEEAGSGGSCGAVHGERLFVADGSRLRWSAPLEPAATEEGTQAAGYADLPSADGDILGMFSYKDELFLFRERGIAVLGVRGDALSFTAMHIPAPRGIVKGSIHKCGGKLLFLAENGLYAFDGNTCKRLNAGGFQELDLSGTSTAACGDHYYATASFGGETCIWCVSGEEGHLIRARAEKLCGGENLLFTAEGELFVLTERGLPPMRRKECVLRTEKSLLGLSSRQKYLDAILIEGKGHFRAEARGERGLPRAVFGRAGEKLRFPLPVRGSAFSLELKTLDEDACVKAVVLDLREEAAW